MTAVIASTLTNMAVFLPIANMSGMVGQMFKEFALTVVYATFFSLLMSFTLTPMLASLIIPEHDAKKHPIGKRMEAMFRSWEKGYRKILTWLLESKLLTSEADEIIESSPALMVKMLRLAGHRGMRFEAEEFSISSVLDEIPPEVVREAVLSVKVFDEAGEEKQCISRRQLVVHSFAVACCARDIAEMAGGQVNPGLACYHCQ